MRFNIELRPGVYRDLVASFSPGDVADFFKQLDWVRDDPVGRSAMYFDPAFGRLAYRQFEFGVGLTKIAIFSLSGNTLTVRRCMIGSPRRIRDGGRLP